MQRGKIANLEFQYAARKRNESTVTVYQNVRFDNECEVAKLRDLEFQELIVYPTSLVVQNLPQGSSFGERHEFTVDGVLVRRRSSIAHRNVILVRKSSSHPAK